MVARLKASLPLQLANWIQKDHLAVNRYEWQLDDGLQQNWSQWQQNYAKQADLMRVTSVCVPFNRLNHS